MLVMHEMADGSIEWRRDGIAQYRRGKWGVWIIGDFPYAFDVWLNRIEISDEEKVMLKLRFG